MSLPQVNRILLGFVVVSLYFYVKWVKLGASGFILDVVRDGYKIPFVALPPPKVSSNNTSALNDTYFVSEAISVFFKS